MRGLTRHRRVSECGWRLNGSNDGQVAVHQSAAGAYFSGLVTCGSVWACPVCSAKIRTRRADELARAVAAWLASGGGVLFVTGTIRHGRSHDLADTFDVVLRSWSETMTGRRWSGCAPDCTTNHRPGPVYEDGLCDPGLRELHGIVGTVRAVETTYGFDNGWHPHLHALVFTTAPLEDDEADDLGDALYLSWSKQIRKKGGAELVPNRENGIVVRNVTSGGDQLGRYLAKLQESGSHVGLEMTRHDLKKRAGRLLPFDFIGPASNGEAWALRLWWQWEEVTKGRQALTYSPGLRDLLGLDVELTDEELAAQDEGGDIVMLLSASEWAAVRHRASWLLELVESGVPPEVIRRCPVP